MSAGIEIKYAACQVFLIFGNEFNKFNITGTGMLYSIYHMILELI